MSLARLLATLPGAGRVEDILLRPERGVPARSVLQAQALEGRGLEGDRSCARTSRGGGSKRQVTLIQAEHLPLVAAWLGRPALAPETLRRNLVISGLNLLAGRALFRDQPVVLELGAEVLLEITGPCEPCSKMEHELGPGAWNALRGHGGVTARVLRGGVIRRHDTARLRAVQVPALSIPSTP